MVGALRLLLVYETAGAGDVLRAGHCQGFECRACVCALRGGEGGVYLLCSLGMQSDGGKECAAQTTGGVPAGFVCHVVYEVFAVECGADGLGAVQTARRPAKDSEGFVYGAHV